MLEAMMTARSGTRHAYGDDLLLTPFSATPPGAFPVKKRRFFPAPEANLVALLSRIVNAAKRYIVGGARIIISMKLAALCGCSAAFEAQPIDAAADGTLPLERGGED